MKKMITIAILIVALATLFLAGCQTPGQPGPDPDPTPGSITTSTAFEEKFDPNVDIKTNSFKTEEEYVGFIKSAQGSGGFAGGLDFARGGLEVAEMAFDSAAVQATTALKSAPSVPNDFSGTNVQVQGVDEGDILKTDGNYIYTITDKTLFIIRAYPGEDAEVVSTINFDDRPIGLFINEDKLAVFGDIQNTNFFAEKGIRMNSGASFLNIYDISDRDDPELNKEFKFEGRYSNSRMIGEDIYIVTNLFPMYRIGYPLPIIIEDDVVRQMPVSDIYYFNIPYHNPHFVGIHSINIDSERNEDSAMLAVEGNPNLYMSKNNMYVTYTERINEWDLQREILQELIDPELPAFYRAIIQKIEATDLDVLTKYEKQSKIQQIYSEYMQGLSRDNQDKLSDRAEEMLVEKLEEFEYFEFTVINKIEVNDGDIDVDVNGKAPGSVLNQFSMDEYDDVFRIGTTVNARWSRFGKERTESTNNVYTFDKDLDMLGELEGLAEGERIFSTRFMGDRLYMVTFRQVDPFFAIDLSNPRKPKSLGELKIPGFSRYLHPYDENTIIGIGRDATSTGRQLGLKISLFDVSDVRNPKEVAKYVSDSRYSRTTAEWEHKAFLFSKEKNLLVIPVVSNEGSFWEEGGIRHEGEKYNGAFVFDIDRNDIDLRGLIDHSEGSTNFWQPLVERSLYIEDLLYTKSPNLLRINELDDLSSVKDVELKSKYAGKISVY